MKNKQKIEEERADKLVSDFKDRIESNEKNKEKLHVVDEVEFYNEGSYTNPYFGAIIRGREEDLKSKVEFRLFGNDAENLQMFIEDKLDDIV